jgi:pimeloyl-ACP methyl ester carboxylesterase/DNA-binding winged helix-turn-helix (wHTH) protein
MALPAKMVYEFGPFRIDAVERMLTNSGQAVSLTPKAFDMLLVLVEHSGRVLAKDELMKRVWPDTFVEEANIAVNISMLRKVLGGEFIQTVPRRGYRFSAEVKLTGGEQDIVAMERTRSRVVIEEVEVPDDRPALLDPRAIDLAVRRTPQTHYAKSGDVNIAYQVVGDAPLDLVFVMGWVSHLECFWQEPAFARFLDRLAAFSRLILFDKRGTGLSDRVPDNQLPTLEQRMDDVRAVMEAVGSSRAALCGVSEGGPMCSLFAATYPEKTIALVMIGTYAKRIWATDYPWAPTQEQRESFFEEMQRDWGGPVGLEERAPSRKDDPLFREWWASYLRMGASPGAAVALTRMNAEIDVRHVLPTIRVPALVIHRTGDRCLKVEEGRLVADSIPGAKLVELSGSDHLPFVGDQDAILDACEEFLTGVKHSMEPDRVLATVLVTETGDGDENGLENLHRHRLYVDRELEWFRGRKVESNGKLLATFDGPARAIRAACAIRESARRLGLKSKSALHTGECDVSDHLVAGVAVDVARQLEQRAGPNEILVSSTVKDLVAGSGIEFRPRGTEVFEGVPGEWNVFTVEQGGCA